MLSPLTPENSIQIPGDPLTLVFLIIWLLTIGYANYRLRHHNKALNRIRLLWLAGLSISVLFLTPFFGHLLSYRGVSAGEISPIRHLMLFAALPWMLAGGLLGILPATLLAGLSGLLLAYLDTNQIFTSLVFMTMAVIHTWCVQQRYRTQVFRILRFSPVSGLLAVGITLPLIFLAMLSSGAGAAGKRIIAAMTELPLVILTLGGMILVSGMICVVVQNLSPRYWGSQKSLVKAPGEDSQRYRLKTIIVSILLLLILISAAASYVNGRRIARNRLSEELDRTTSLVAEGMTEFIQTGVWFVDDLSNQPFVSEESPELTANQFIHRSMPYTFFDEFVLIDNQGGVIVIYSRHSQAALAISLDEIAAVELVIAGTHSQILSLPPEDDGQAAVFSFISGVQQAGHEGITNAVVARSGLYTNHIARSYIGLLETYHQQGGTSQIIGADGFILYDSNPERVMTFNPQPVISEPKLIQESSQDGQRHLRYVQPVESIGWQVVIKYPEILLQALAWELAVPGILLSIIGSVIILIVFTKIVSPAYDDIAQVTQAAEQMLKGDFSIDLPATRSGSETEKLAKVLQDLSVSLKGRVKKQTDLLSVNTRMTGNLTLEESLRWIMAAAMERGVAAVRLLINDQSIDEKLGKALHPMGMGKYAQPLSALDQEMFAIVQTQGSFVLRDFEAGKSLSFEKGMPLPASVIAVPLEIQNRSLGLMWVAYQDLRSPDEDEVSYFQRLAQKASVVIWQDKQHKKALFSQQLLELVFNQIPDAVLISNYQDEVVYFNQAANSLFSHADQDLNGRALEEILNDKSFNKEHFSDAKGVQSHEFHGNDGRAFNVLISEISLPDQLEGQVLIFQDITNQMKAESLKTEYVTTVSHELRSPLSLIQGYAKILRLTGNLNTQQDSYIGNIIEGIDEMKALVQKLLDIGRLETGKALDLTKISAEEIILNVVESLEALARQKNIKMSVTTPENPLYIDADNTFLTQAVKNLVENAIKFTKMGGEVTLSIRDQDTDVTFVIKDNGIGIAPLDQNRLFRRFNRINPPVGQEQEGSGLGLAIVKSITERHGGRVWVESQLGMGSTFYLQIPKHNPALLSKK